MNEECARPCTCGRSATGFCRDLHRLTDEEWDRMLLEDIGPRDDEDHEEEDPL